MNRREFLVGAAAAAVAPSIPSVALVGDGMCLTAIPHPINVPLFDGIGGISWHPLRLVGHYSPEDVFILGMVAEDMPEHGFARGDIVTIHEPASIPERA